jgi:hypothetical protein
MDRLIEAHGILAKLVEVILLISQRHRHGLHEYLCELSIVLQVEHASFPERFSQLLRPQIWAKAKLLVFDMRVVGGNLTAVYLVQADTLG